MNKQDYSGFKHKEIMLLIMLAGLTSASQYAKGADNFDVPISREIEVNIQRTEADGKLLLLWLPSESGLLQQEKNLAVSLSRSHIETWFADMLGAYFMPSLASSVDNIKSSDTAELIERVRQKSNKKIILIGAGRGAALVLRAARAWQVKYGQQAKLGGVILISPKLFVETPEPGKAGQLLPVINKTNLPVFIIQPENSPWRWKMGSIVPALEKSGSDVYVWFLKKARDRFYYRPDATAREDTLAAKLAFYITTARVMLESFQTSTRSVSKVKITETKQRADGKKERLLRAYTGEPQPPALKLDDLQGNIKDLERQKGKVVLVNFWASWCPPCVHEMPSMQRLLEHFKGRQFDIFAVNMAEDIPTIQTFLREKVQVNFPILLDKDGDALKRWKVFAFPTSYIIGKQGKIRLALFGSIDWMKPDVISKIKKLIDE